MSRCYILGELDECGEINLRLRKTTLLSEVKKLQKKGDFQLLFTIIGTDFSILNENYKVYPVTLEDLK